jgi:hypothetical protein
MNPKTTIKPWLLACSEQGGIGAVDAYETSAPEMSEELEDIYFVFQVTGGIPTRHTPMEKRSLPDPEGWDVEVSGTQFWKMQVQVDLFNSQNGLSELAGCAVAAEKDQEFTDLFKAHGLSFVAGSAEVQNLTTRDETGFYHHHRMTCHFNTTQGFKHTKTNHRVSAINIDDAFTLE